MDKLFPSTFPEPTTQLSLLGLRDDRDWADLAEELQARFAYYQGLTPTLAQMSPTPTTLLKHKAHLYGIYDSKSKLATEIKNAVIQLYKRRCPYCGVPTAPTTIDHFVPRAEWAEFAFYSLNLIPSCYDCNHDKGTQVWESDGRRKFINPFYDAFLSIRFFGFEVIPDAQLGFDDPVFNLTYSQTLTVAERATVADHFRLLGVENKITAFIRSRVKVIRRRYRREICDQTLTVQALGDDLRKDVEAEAAVNGVNSWMAIAVRTILDNPTYLNFIATEPIH